MEMNRFVLRLGVLLLALTVSIMAGESDKKSLQGLGAVYVLIESLDSEIEQAGLHKTDIQTDIELKLRLAGIKVSTEEEHSHQPGSPYFYVNLNIHLSHENPGLAYYAIDCELRQDVTLRRDESISTVAATWQTGKAGVVGASNLRRIRDSIT